MKKPDILLFLSDQHSGSVVGYDGDDKVRTPYLDYLATQGTTFSAAYCAFPLCVPSRTSLLSGMLPSTLQIMDNAGAMKSDQATWLHALANEGYETILCGRMHFIGPDQRHGFTKRIAPDITPTGWGEKAAFKKELGDFEGTVAEKGCLALAGGGNSPVLEYDRMVIDSAISYLAQDHEKPQCIVVGTYAPHFPYVGPKEAFAYYQQRIQNTSFADGLLHPALRHKQQHADATLLQNVRAAYYAMVETMDAQIHAVHVAWESFLHRGNRKGVFAYLSDHGDMLGINNLFGKKAFHDRSTRVPLMFVGSGVEAGIRVEEPVSLLDIGPTICEIARVPSIAGFQGVSLVPALQGFSSNQDRTIISEVLDSHQGQIILGRMIRKGPWKLICYHGFEEEDFLFNMIDDPLEKHNVRESYPSLYEALRKRLYDGWAPERVMEQHLLATQHHSVVARFGALQNRQKTERWPIPAIRGK